MEHIDNDVMWALSISNNGVKRSWSEKFVNIDSFWLEEVHIIDLFIVLDILDFHRNHVVFGNSCRIKIFSIPRALGHKFLFIEVFWASCDINFVMPNAH